MPEASFAETRAIGKPVALEARADERLVRGLISMMTTRPVFGSCAHWTLQPPMTPIASTIRKASFFSRSSRSLEIVARVDADRVDVLDEADGDHLVLRVAHDLDLELLPVEDRLLDEALVGERGVEPARADRAELLDVVAEAAAGAAHRVGGADDDRVADLAVDERDGLLDRVDDRLDAERLHRRLEDLAILAALDGVQIDADHLDAILVENPLL